MRIDLPLGSECLLSDGRPIEPIDSPGGKCEDCVFPGATCVSLSVYLPCHRLTRRDGRTVHFREIIMVADQETTGSPY